LREPTTRDVKVPVSLALGARNLIKNLRAPMLITASLAQPLIWLVLFSQIFRGLADTPAFRRLGYGSYLEFLVPGMVVLSMLFTGLQSGLATSTDIATGMMDKLLISPIRRSRILAGRVMADAVTMLLQGAIILGAALLMGTRVRTGWMGAIALLASATILGVVWASVPNLIALRTKNSELTMVGGLLMTLPILFLTPAFFPEPLLPEWIRRVAAVNPVAYVIETGQRLMSLGTDWGQDLRTLIAVAVASVVLIPLAVLASRSAAE
jgi:ABC-2 type transport system permease protein